MPRPDPASTPGAGGPDRPDHTPRSPAAASLGDEEADRPSLFDPALGDPALGDPEPGGPEPGDPAYASAGTPDPWAAGVPTSNGRATQAPPAPQPRASGSGRRPPRRRGKPRKKLAVALIAFALVLILAGIAVASYPFYTDIVAGRKQANLRSVLDKVKGETGADRLRALEAYANRDFGTGSAITYIDIPSLGVHHEVVVQGVTDAALNVGAGHYPQTPLPGEVGNVAIAGHRTMNGHPFGDLNKLVPGDKIILETPFQTFTYSVVPPFDGHNNPWIVQPTDWSVISFPTQDKYLTLTTCNPPGQQTNRLVARAVLTA